MARVLQVAAGALFALLACAREGTDRRSSSSAGGDYANTRFSQDEITTDNIQGLKVSGTFSLAALVIAALWSATLFSTPE